MLRPALMTAIICFSTFSAWGDAWAEPSQPPSLPSVSEVTESLDRLYRSNTAHGTMSMEIVTRRYKRSLELESWSRGEEHALIVIRRPAREAGTASLKTPDGLWSYAPRADRLLRIPPGMLSDGWMGSHISNDDLLRDSSWREDFETSLAAVQEGGRRTLKLTAIPKPDTPVVYSKIVWTVDAETMLPLRSEDFDGERIARTTTFSDVRDFGGRRLPSTITVVPSKYPEESTVMRYTAMRFDAKVDNRMFTPRGLKKAAKKR